MYEFERADGTLASAYFALSEMPRIGEFVDIDGEMCKRVMSLPRVNVVDLGHEAVNMLSLRHGVDPDVPRYSPEGVPGLVGGFPLFKDRAEIREYEAKQEAKGSTLRYDP